MAGKSRKPLYPIATLLFVAFSYLAFEYFGTAPAPVDDQSGSSLADESQPSAPLPPVGTATDFSIAVLPFANASADADQNYLSEGLSRELLELLSEIPQLEVASRGAALQFFARKRDRRQLNRTPDSTVTKAEFFRSPATRNGNWVKHPIAAHDPFRLTRYFNA